MVHESDTRARRVLVTGGGSTQNLSSAELYDPATNGWTPAGNMAEVRYLHTATALPDGRVLLAGGYDSVTIHASTINILFICI